MAVLVGYVGNSFHVETIALSGTSQQIDITTPFVAVPEVFANEQPAGVQTAHQQSFDKVVGGHVGQRLVEALQDQLICPMLMQGLQFVAKAADLGGNQFWTLAASGEVGARMRVERHDGGSEMPLFGAFAQTRQDSLVAAVDAVEIAYRYCAGALRIEAGKGAVDAGRCFHTREFTISAGLHQELLCRPFFLPLFAVLWC